MFYISNIYTVIPEKRSKKKLFKMTPRGYHMIMLVKQVFKFQGGSSVLDYARDIS